MSDVVHRKISILYILLEIKLITPRLGAMEALTLLPLHAFMARTGTNLQKENRLLLKLEITHVANYCGGAFIP
jgi:hypothetical protein